MTKVWGTKVEDENELIRAAKIAGVESDGPPDEVAKRINESGDRPEGFLFASEAEKEQEETLEEAGLSKK